MTARRGGRHGAADGASGATRRGFFTHIAGIAAAGAALTAESTAPALAKTDPAAPAQDAQVEPFWGKNQGGILTPPQGHTYFAALDLTTEKRDDIIALLKAWTNAAAQLASGKPIDTFTRTELAYNYDTTTTTTTTASSDPTPTPVSLSDSGEADGLSPARLTLTFGFGAGLFEKDGKDRYGLAKQRPAALADLPHFAGDELAPERTGGDLSIQACADDPQVAFHAVRQLARLADDVAQVRWAQTGFLPGYKADQTPRNLMGFRDGTNNPSIADPAAMAEFIWVGTEGPDWMRGGSYMVTRRIRMALEHWDKSKLDLQEQTFGRHKPSGAPIGLKNEKDTLDLDATDKDGNYLIAENSHVRLAAAASNDGARILRRAYSYNDGVNFTAERWPPWRQGLEYDAGLFFISYQRDPRTGFVKLFEKMAKLDMLNQFVTHVGGGLFAIPPGAAQGEFIGQKLFEAA
ncbi:MAG TPA: iron uptake transporter deferrochelatase/peroxidase subunit [Stellaceae bacterium]|jgi:deferrochelatase/peroxidase EfeB|nr:iron uptake transporter deferrochelatase/peroxidase subunit [Stellaceae bacterium]